MEKKREKRKRKKTPFVTHKKTLFQNAHPHSFSHAHTHTSKLHIIAQCCSLKNLETKLENGRRRRKRESKISHQNHSAGAGAAAAAPSPSRAAASASFISALNCAAISSARSNTAAGLRSMSPGVGSSFFVESEMRPRSRSWVRTRTLILSPGARTLSMVATWSCEICETWSRPVFVLVWGGGGVYRYRGGGRKRVSFCFVFRLSTPKRRRRKRKRGTKKKGNFFRQLTVDAPAEVDEGSVDLDGRDRADDDVAYFFCRC